MGAGEGAFLRSLLPRCGSVEALEKNPDAAERLRAAGIKVRDTDVREDAVARPGRADVVCAFQVLEHVADVRGFLSALAAIVVPGVKSFCRCRTVSGFAGVWSRWTVRRTTSPGGALVSSRPQPRSSVWIWSWSAISPHRWPMREPRARNRSGKLWNRRWALGRRVRLPGSWAVCGCLDVAMSACWRRATS
ncbi:methyltransferase domain-containing protein [Streptomyces sp. NPDC047009]|uniref:class I SAM-dependent methyltransferase n=1 Tax=Streptomyces sp. NPDC047009 TaxID=3154496 RepID=UPI0033D07362